jgi:hypothetical protein
MSSHLDEILQQIRQDIISKKIDISTIKLVDTSHNEISYDFKSNKKQKLLNPNLSLSTQHELLELKNQIHQLTVENERLKSSLRLQMPQEVIRSTSTDILMTALKEAEEETSNNNNNNNITTPRKSDRIASNKSYEGESYSTPRKRKRDRSRQIATTEALVPEEIQQEEIQQEETEENVTSSINEQIQYYSQKLASGLENQQLINLNLINIENLTRLQQLLRNSNNEAELLMGGQEIASIIASSKFLKMIGHYFRSIVAFNLKSAFKGKFQSKFRELMQIKSKSDASTYINLYEFVHLHYAEQTNDITALCRIPIFTASITWEQWRKLLTKNNLHIIETALAQLKSTSNANDKIEHNQREYLEFIDRKLGRVYKAEVIETVTNGSCGYDSLAKLSGYNRTYQDLKNEIFKIAQGFLNINDNNNPYIGLEEFVAKFKQDYSTFFQTTYEDALKARQKEGVWMSDYEAILAGLFLFKSKIISVTFDSNNPSSLFAASHKTEAYAEQLEGTQLWENLHSKSYYLFNTFCQSPFSWQEGKIKDHWMGLKVISWEEIKLDSDISALLPDWLEIYQDPKVGQGVRATKNKKRSNQVVADLKQVCPPVYEIDPNSHDDYLFTMKDKTRITLKYHWSGKINHLPFTKANMKISETGKLTIIKNIKAGDILSLDYGVDFWVAKITGVDIEDWHNSGERSDIFDRMHNEVEDYTELLEMKLQVKLPSAEVLDNLLTYLDVNQQS